MGVLTVCFHFVALSVKKDVHVYLPCGSGMIEEWHYSPCREKLMVLCRLYRFMHFFEQRNYILCVVCVTIIDPLLMQLHPDSDPSNPTLHGQFVELNEAYRVLSKDLSRKEYDVKIRHPYSGGQAFRSTSSHTNYRARWRFTQSVLSFVTWT